MAKKNPKASDGQMDSTSVKLIRHRGRMAFTILATMVLTFVFFLLIVSGTSGRVGIAWYALSVPIIFLGLLTNLLQPEEEWQYTPWQQATQKYEKNIYD